MDLSKNETRSYQEEDDPVQIQEQGWRKGLMHLQRMTEQVSALYDSCTNRHYISKDDRKKANMSILKKSAIRVGVANSLLSVGKFADDGNTSIFTRDEVTVHKEEDVLITCKGKPILIRCRDQDGRHQIPLV